jgi:hypothetical protein
MIFMLWGNSWDIKVFTLDWFPEMIYLGGSEKSKIHYRDRIEYEQNGLFQIEVNRPCLLEYIRNQAKFGFIYLGQIRRGW